MTLKAGNVVNDAYLIEEKIGSGGFGDVWKALDLKQGKPVALKQLKHRWSGCGRMVDLFRSEFHVLMKLSHPCIIEPSTLVQENGYHLFVMEYLDGGNLDERIKESGVIDPATALTLTVRMLEVINTCSRRNIIHGDIKPANIIFGDQSFDHPKLGDFGLFNHMAAQFYPRDAKGQRKTMGTPAYMPPEKLTGRKLTVKSDIYSLGMTLYKMLTGRLFFNEDLLDHSGVLQAVTMGVRENPSRYRPEIPGWLDRLVLSMIATEIHKRPKCARGILYEIRRHSSACLK